MEINVVELIVQAGGLGLAALLVFLVVRYGGAYLDKLICRLMDNLDQQNKNYESNIKVQAGVATALTLLCDRLDKMSIGQGQQTQDTIDALAEMSKCIEALGRQLQAHESRIEKRFEQQMGQSNERHAELIGVLRHLNGK